MEKLKEFFTKPIYKSIQVWHVALLVIIIGAAGGGLTDSEEEEKEKEEENTSNKSGGSEITYEEILSFMQEHASGAGQEVVEGKKFQIGKVSMYIFITKTNDFRVPYCWTTVSVNKIILNTECGSYRKILDDYLNCRLN